MAFKEENVPLMCLLRPGTTTQNSTEIAGEPIIASDFTFKLVMAAAKTWHKLKGENQLPKVVQGIKFQNGVEVISTPPQNAA